MPLIDHPGLAAADADAGRRFAEARRCDPFPHIPPSLLSSADIYDYVRLTGMLYPFSPENLKSASYEAAIGGRCIWWESSGEQGKLELTAGNEFVLKANSIAFVQVEPYFRLPDYIAMRFNLKITHVHRGILLGTGPLVDPGFVGRLLIPLHNLTTNEYKFSVGDGLIWIEFTKTSALPAPYAVPLGTVGLGRRGRFYPFPDQKQELEPEDYLRKASPHKPIQSSIPEALSEGRRAAVTAATSAEDARASVTRLTQFGIAALILAMAAVLVPTWSLVSQSTSLTNDVQKDLRETVTREKERDTRMRKVEEEAGATEDRLMREVASLRERLDALSKDLKRLSSSIKLKP